LETSERYYLLRQILVVDQLLGAKLRVLSIGGGASIGLLDLLDLSHLRRIHSLLGNVRVDGIVRLHLLGWRVHASLLHAALRHAGRGGGLGISGAASAAGVGFLAGDNVNEEVEHVGLGQGRGNVGALQGAALVLLSVDPGPHGQLGNEDVAALCEQDGRLGRDHLNLRVGLHHLLYPREGQLMQLEVVVVRLELGDLVLPVDIEHVLRLARETLRYLFEVSANCGWWPRAYIDAIAVRSIASQRHVRVARAAVLVYLHLTIDPRRPED
jgi:hypothetical protein